MPGLLAELDLKIGGFDVSAILGGVVGQLGDLGGATQGLTGGPGVVGQILEALKNPPQPDGLDGVGNFSASVTGVLALIPSDTSGPLGPLLEPFQGLRAAGSISVSVTGLKAAFDAVRALVELTTGRVFGGPQPMPDGSPPPDAIDLARIRGVIDDVEAQIEQLGDSVDPSRLVALLQRFGPAAQDLHTRWPKMPVMSDLFEALDLVGRWQQMSPAELTEHLARTLAGGARLIALPRARWVDPALQCARDAGRAADTFARAGADIGPILRDLPARFAAGRRVSGPELALLAARLDDLERLADALRPASPLADVEALPRQLEREFMRVLRVVHPAIDRAGLEQRVRQLAARVPAADASPLGDVVTAVEQLDLTAITAPLSAVKNAIQGAVDTARGALETVKNALTDLLRPFSDAIATVTGAIGLDRLQGALEQLPDLINGFVDGEIKSRLTSLKADVEQAVHTVSGAVDRFDPGAIKGQIEDMVRQVASVVQNPQVRDVFAAAQAVVGDIVAALEGFPAALRGAADESVRILDQVRDAASKIPADLIPDAAKPALQTAVDTIADLDITGTVGQPLADVVETALDQGVRPILTEFEGLLGGLRQRLESFKPSSLISDDLDKPFQDLFAQLRGFTPSDLLKDIEAALAELREKIHVVDPEELLRPLLDLYADLLKAIEAIDPDKLLAPVEAEIQRTIQHILESSGVAGVFDGVRDFLEQLDAWVDLLGHARSAFTRLADRLARPVSVDAQLDQLTGDALARVAQVEFAALGEALAAGQLAARALDHRLIAAELAPALRAAASAADALIAADAQALVAAVRGLPEPALLRFHDPAFAPLGQRLFDLADVLSAAADPWHALAPRLTGMAGRLEGELRGYALLGTIDGRHVLADFLEPPGDLAALGQNIGDALRESLRLPVLALAALLERIAPHAGAFAGDLGRLLGAIHGKLDAITGDGGLLGSVKALDEGLDLLRHFDLSPIKDPLRTQVYQPIQGVVAAINPEPLRAVLQAVKDALGGLLDLASLIDRSTLDELDSTYAEAVNKLAEFSPRKLIADTVDPVYEELLAEVLPLFDLVTRLREAVDKAADEVPPAIVAQLRRVEEAFDALLRALPLQPTGGPAVSASASVSVGGGS